MTQLKTNAEEDGAAPEVTVCVITYNHEKYISQCLESIISQECNFSYEVVIRDDCSTDSTKKIIESFRKKHPNIIRLIDSDKNIGANKNLLKVFEKSRGRYIALCEGDDYWINSKKLQIQIDAMRAHAGATFCSHACRIHDREGLGEVAYIKGVNSLAETTCDDILNVSGQFSPTGSYFFTREAISTLPEWFADAPVGDFFIEMYGVVAGRGLHLNQPMSAYRTFSENSWSTQNNEQNAQQLVNFSMKMSTYLRQMSETENFRSFDFSRKIAASDFNAAIGALLTANANLFRLAIQKSWESKPRLSVTQAALYRLRKHPKAALFLYYLKRWRALA